MLKAILKGIPASSGKARGIVVIVISKKDFKKVKDGNILVTKHTDPSMLLIMQRVSAIITDQGGLTSHAAVVSREMGTPCIVGTVSGTKRLKNGDMIEVDADKGTVKLVSK